MHHSIHYWKRRRGEPVTRKNASIPLPENWQEIRLAVMERDINCVECGDDGVGVHHNDHNRLNNSLDNLALLCWPCHSNHHHRLRYPAGI